MAVLVRRLFITLRAVIYMTGFVLLWGWVALRVHVFDRSLGVALPVGTRILGVIFMGLGGILALACAGVFVAQGQGTPAPFDAPRNFVAIGPYRCVLNPTHIGALTVLVGFGLYEYSVSILLLCLVVFALVHLFIVVYEEPGLKARFGVTYSEYCAGVPRWIPHLRC